MHHRSFDPTRQKLRILKLPKSITVLRLIIGTLFSAPRFGPGLKMSAGANGAKLGASCLS